ncbi:hypothetical protein VNO77_15290 [Canavalia gladiata]|uniref:Uncharacterized protein n=1 Tax=Canavalia gladiata TaxID=3824 RepID=A0AAN9QSA7_CANGL
MFYLSMSCAELTRIETLDLRIFRLFRTYQNILLERSTTLNGITTEPTWKITKPAQNSRKRSEKNPAYHGGSAALGLASGQSQPRYLLRTEPARTVLGRHGLKVLGTWGTTLHEASLRVVPSPPPLWRRLN